VRLLNSEKRNHINFFFKQRKYKSVFFKIQILKRTLGDIMCDVSRLSKVQKWVTLQANTEYNDFERCVEKRQLDVRSIAAEITRELEAAAVSGTARSRERVRSRTLPAKSRTSLLYRVAPITHNRVPEDFVFPEEVKKKLPTRQILLLLFTIGQANAPNDEW
jgi:hypothetical protein